MKLKRLKIILLIIKDIVQHILLGFYALVFALLLGVFALFSKMFFIKYCESILDNEKKNDTKL